MKKKLEKSGEMETEYNPFTWKELVRELERSGKLHIADRIVSLYFDERERYTLKMSSLIGELFTKIAELSDTPEEAMLLGYYIGHAIGHRVGRRM